jgi:hypothetical protein
MEIFWRRLSHSIKVVVGKFIGQSLKTPFFQKKGSASRLYQVFSNPKTQDHPSHRILLQPVSLPLVEPELFITGLDTKKYLQMLTEHGDKSTCTAGIISANNIDISFPIGMHSWNNKVFEDALLCTGILTNPKYLIDLETIQFRKKDKLPEAVLLSLPWHHNFFHWLIEILPRLLLYDMAEDLHRLPIIVPSSSPKFVKDSLALTGYIDRVSFIDNGVYKFEKLHILSRLSKTRDISPFAIKWLNNKIPEKTISKKKRIYVSRADAKIRYITNELDVQKVLSEFGFETVVMSQLTLEEQIQVFRQAEIVVGSHGAAFAHLAFIEPGAIFIEFFELGHCNRCFYRMASLKNLKYGFIVGKRDGFGFYVDTSQLRSILEKALL